MEAFLNITTPMERKGGSEEEAFLFVYLGVLYFLNGTSVLCNACV